MDKLIKIVFSRWCLLVYVVALALFVMPSNSPVGIPGDYKVIPATIFVIAIMELLPIWKDKDSEVK